MDELKERLKGFDWYYMFSDDGNEWRKWSARKHEIIKWAKSQNLNNSQILNTVKSICDDHHVVSDWTIMD